MLYLLDTNVISHIARYPAGACAQDAGLVGYEGLCTSIIVAAEIQFGLQINPALRSRNQVLDLLANIEVLPFETPAEMQYAKLRSTLHFKGTLVGALDMLIAAHAMALDCTLVTDNMREFERIEGLRIENWLR